MRPTRAGLILVCGLHCACVDDVQEDVPVRETGYIVCTLSEACDGSLRCERADGGVECVELPVERAACEDDPCVCWAAEVCAVGDQCALRDDGFACVAPELVGEAVPLTEVRALGACVVPGDPERIDVSLLLATRDPAETSARLESIGPAARIEGTDRSVEHVLSAASFAFAGLDGAAPIIATRGEEGVEIAPTPRTIRFDGPGERERLLILAVDNSGSLIGEQPGGDVDISRATDRRDERIAFLRTLANRLDPAVHLSVVGFWEEGGRPVITGGDGSQPSLNRDLTASALTDLESGSTGGTPLAAVLKSIREDVVGPNDGLQASVMLVTDGIEDGDPTDLDRALLDAEIAAYADLEVPVHVIQLRPPVSAGHDRARDPKLVELACRSGGDFAFFEDPSEFTRPAQDWARWFGLRQDGAWRLTVELPGAADLAPGWWSLSGQLALTIGAFSRAIDLGPQPDPEIDDDDRLWLWLD